MRDKQEYEVEQEGAYPDLNRSEEIQAIIGRMPNRFGIWITSLVVGLAIVLVIFGCIIRYPDVVTGQIVINSSNSPVKLVANTPGKLFLNKFQTQDDVKEGEYIAIIENAANLEDILKVQTLIRDFNINGNNASSNFPHNLSLGEVNPVYFAFITAMEQYAVYHRKNMLTQQEETFKNILIQQQEVLNVTTRKLEISRQNVRLAGKFYERDSTLFSRRVLTEAELDKSKMTLNSVRDNYSSMLNNITSIKEQLEETTNKLQQVSIQISEKEKQTSLELMTSYSALLDRLKSWEQKYALKAPVNGIVQFLKFWQTGQFIEAGEPAFTVIPVQSEILGQVTLPSYGAGKVKIGQEVIIKLDDYPYMEYGSIKGKVASVSLTSNPVRTEKGNIETYLVTVDLPEQLKTNYGSKLDFKFEIKGTGEIIVNDRRLGERLFDNLRYAVKK